MDVPGDHEGDLDYPIEMLLPLPVNAFTDDNMFRFAKGSVHLIRNFW
jgi:hypothetical protein